MQVSCVAAISVAAVFLALFTVAAEGKNNYYGIALSPYQKNPANATCRSVDELNTIVAKIADEGFKSIELEYLGYECQPSSISTVYAAAKKHNVVVQPTLFLNYALADNKTDYELQRKALLDAVAQHPEVTDVFLFGGEAINRRTDTEANLRAAFDSLVKDLAKAGFKGRSTINEPVDASLAVAMCDLDFLGISLDPWYEYDPPGPSNVTEWMVGRITNLRKLCPKTKIHVTRFGWTSNATEWGPIKPSLESMGQAFHGVNAAIGNGTFGSIPFTAWEYDDQLWKFATDFLAAAKVGTFVERYYGLFDKPGFSFDDQVAK